jgi:hypothetical protein
MTALDALPRAEIPVNAQRGKCDGKEEQLLSNGGELRVSQDVVELLADAEAFDEIDGVEVLEDLFWELRGRENRCRRHAEPYVVALMLERMK